MLDYRVDFNPLKTLANISVSDTELARCTRWSAILDHSLLTDDRKKSISL